MEGEWHGKEQTEAETDGQQAQTEVLKMGTLVRSARKPMSVLEASGALKKHPERRRDEPNTGRGIGPPPDYLTDTEKQIWNDTVADCAPGVFQSSDRAALLLYVQLAAEASPAEIVGGKWQRKKDWDYVPIGKVDMLLKLFGKFGMTPTDRGKVAVPPQPAAADQPKTGLAKFLTPAT